MVSYVRIVTLLLSLVPQILSIIQAVEKPGNGADKAATVTQLVIAGFDVVPDDLKKEIGLDKVQGFVQKVIDIAVGFLNKIGAFKK